MRLTPTQTLGGEKNALGRSMQTSVMSARGSGWAAISRERFISRSWSCMAANCLAVVMTYAAVSSAIATADPAEMFAARRLGLLVTMRITITTAQEEASTTRT